MIYPAPPYLTALAWMMGKISDSEAEEMFRDREAEETFREWREITELTSEEGG